MNKISKDKYSIYLHINKVNGKMYVGITKNNPEKRWGNNGNQYKRQPKFYNAIQKYGWNNFEHEIFANNLIKEEACNMEIKLISKLNAIDYGYNIALGGNVLDGINRPKGYTHYLSKQIYQYDIISKKLIKYWGAISDIVLHYNNSTQYKIEKACKELIPYLGFYWSYNEIKDFSEYKTQELDHVSKIYQYDLQGNFIKVYNNKNEVIKENKNLNWESIYRAYVHYVSSSGGYIWSETNDINSIKEIVKENILIYRRETIPIIQYDLNGKYIKRYKSINKATEELFNSNTTIAGGIFKCCIKEKNIQKSHGFIWKFDYEYLNNLNFDVALLYPPSMKFKIA
jgi:hypothetical protein